MLEKINRTSQIKQEMDENNSYITQWPGFLLNFPCYLLKLGLKVYKCYIITEWLFLY